MEKTKSMVFSKLKEKRSAWCLGLGVIGILIILPFIVTEFWVCLSTEIFILGLAGMSVNLLLGYGGWLPFGHAAFYATGAYVTAILLKKMGISAVVVLIISPFFAALIGAIFALFVVRLYRFYFAMMTAAFSMILWTIIRKWASLTGGDDGMTGVEFPEILSGTTNTYFFTLVIVLLAIITLYFIINSPFGWTLRAIRENATRAAFTSIDVVRHRYIAFIISSFFCGIAGSLYVVYSHSTFPDYAYWVKSGDLVMVCIFGGMSSFLGPMVGAAILTLLQTLVTSMTLYWPLVIGIIIFGVVLLMPDGVMGMGVWGKFSRILLKKDVSLLTKKG